MSLVFDSSALLAFLKNENGADAVSELLAEGDVPKIAHAANLCEVFYLVAKEDGDDAANQDIADLHALGLEERNDMDGAFWRDAANLIADCKRQKRPLALGDAFGIALARREDADFVTADSHELEAVRASGAARIIFIR